MQVEFSVEIADLKTGLKTLFSSTSKGKQAESEYFDFSANDGEMTLDGQGFSYTCPAEVRNSGSARVPYGIMDRLRPMLATLKEKSVTVSVTDGQFKLGGTCITNVDIKILPSESRIAELPIDAPLPMVLALTTRFTDQELEDSGLHKRALKAMAEADGFIDSAAQVLEPLGITREAVRTFVWNQIKQQYAEGKRAE
jgi:hypothetical protein